MDILEKAIRLSQRAGAVIQEHWRGPRTFTLYVSNGTAETLNLSAKPPVPKGGKFVTSFENLASGHAGYVRCTSANGDIGGTVEFTVGGETLECKVSNFRSGKAVFNLLFKDPPESEPAEVTYLELDHRDYLLAMGRTSSSTVKMSATLAARGRRYACFVDDMVTGQNFSASVRIGSAEQIVLTTSKRGRKEVHLKGPYCLSRKYALQKLSFCMWCKNNRREHLAQALFLMELRAVKAGLGGLDIWDQAFMLSLLVCSFIVSGIIAGLDVEAELKLWRSSKGHVSDETAYSNYRPSHRHQWRSGQLSLFEDFVSAAVILLETAALQCGQALATHLDTWAQAAFPQEFRASTALCKMRSMMVTDENAKALGEHINTLKEENSKDFSKGSIRDPEMADVTSTVREEDDSLESAMMTLIRGCITDSTMFTVRSQELFEVLIKDLTGREEAVAALQKYLDWVPATQRCFECDELMSDVFPSKKGKRKCSCCKKEKKRNPSTSGKTAFHCLGAEAFANLNGQPAHRSAQELLKSLGEDSPPYRVLATNSKSGECFFFSNDDRFLVKTITPAEGEVFFRMLPAYQGHKRKYRHSLIIGYDALFCVYDHATEKPIYISVMSSVFDRAFKISHTFDLKGSLLGRRSKPKEKVRKDQDWLDGSWKMQLADDARREFCAIHEEDAGFLMSFGVMDYSILLGVHELPKDNDTALRPTQGNGHSIPGRAIRDTSGQIIYFVGIIDFFIGYGLKKEGEHMLRAAQGHAADASCVDPESYARRAVEFVRSHVVASKDHRDRVGSFGELRVEIKSAEQLINADGMFGVSDPYVKVWVGLQQLRTPTIKNNLNPEWNFVGSVPIDTGHLFQDVTLEVWDEDHHRKVQGSDDLLGRTSIPISEVLDRCAIGVGEKEQPAKLKVPEVLQGAPSGRLHAEVALVIPGSTLI